MIKISHWKYLYYSRATTSWYEKQILYNFIFLLTTNCLLHNIHKAEVNSMNNKRSQNCGKTYWGSIRGQLDTSYELLQSVASCLCSVEQRMLEMKQSQLMLFCVIWEITFTCALHHGGNTWSGGWTDTSGYKCYWW